MWIFCKSGFFSAVQHFENPDIIHIRSRFRGDLENLCERHGIEPDVKKTPRNDYKEVLKTPSDLQKMVHPLTTYRENN